MTTDERIATALLLGGVFEKLEFGVHHARSGGWYCYEPSGTPGANFSPNYPGSLTKGSAATRYMESIGYEIGDDGEIRVAPPPAREPIKPLHQCNFPDTAGG